MFQSTPSLRRATIYGYLLVGEMLVSIHALLAESDRPGNGFGQTFAGFNPRPPCGERRAMFDFGVDGLGFQSTPSLRRATPGAANYFRRARFQSTPSLRRATAPTVHVVNQSCKRGFAPTSRRRYITYRLLFIILGCQSAFSNVLQESPTSRQFDVSLGLAQRPCQTALK